MENNFLLSLIMGAFVGGIAGYLGSLMVTKRMALVGDALSHVALPGMGLALLYGFNVSLGALIFLAAGVVLIWFFESKTKLPFEALTGIAFTTSLAVGFLVTPDPELAHALVGDISQIGLIDLIASMVLLIFIFFTVRKIMANMVLATISEDLAKVNGINPKKYNFIYLVSIALIVALGIRVVGSLLMGALVIVPASAARSISRNLSQYSFGSMIIGAISCILGILLYGITGISAGPLIILVSTFLFLTLTIFKKR